MSVLSAVCDMVCGILYRTFGFTWAVSGTRYENAEFVTYFETRMRKYEGKNRERDRERESIKCFSSCVPTRYIVTIAAAVTATTATTTADIVVVVVSNCSICIWELHVLRVRTRTISKWSVR